MTELPERLQAEIEHGRWLAEHNPEAIWGWDSPAGRLRAERRARWLVRAVDLSPGMRVLEVGCGTGLFTEVFARTGAKITAIDLSEDLLGLAENREGLGANVEFVHSSLEGYTSSSQFDAVLGSSVLHHLDLERALLKIRGLLRGGGRFTFAEPNGINPQIFLQKRIAWLKRKVGDVSSEAAFTRWSIEKLITDCGFVEVSVEPRDWLHPATPRRLISTMLPLQDILERLPLIREVAGSLYLSARKVGPNG